MPDLLSSLTFAQSSGVVTSHDRSAFSKVPGSATTVVLSRRFGSSMTPTTVSVLPSSVVTVPPSRAPVRLIALRDNVISCWDRAGLPSSTVIMPLVSGWFRSSCRTAARPTPAVVRMLTPPRSTGTRTAAGSRARSRSSDGSWPSTSLTGIAESLAGSWMTGPR